MIEKNVFGFLASGHRKFDVIEQVVGVGFLTLLKKKYDLNADLDFTNRERFNHTALNFSGLVSNEERELVMRIMLCGLVTPGEEAVTLYKELQRYSLVDLYDLITRSLYSQDMLPIESRMNLTSYDIVELVYRLTNNREIKSILDICSGNGNFLSSMIQKYPNASIRGIEKHYSTNLVLVIRLYLINVGYKYLENEFAFSQSLDREYDLVFCDFSRNEKNPREIKQDINPRIHFENIQNKADWGFIEKAINSFKDGGRAVVLVNEGTLYNIIDGTNRMKLIKNKLVEMVISLPYGTSHESLGSYSLVVFSQNNDAVKFVDGSKCFKLDKKRKTIDVDAIMNLINIKGEKYIEINNDTIMRDRAFCLSAKFYFQDKILLVKAKSLKEIAYTFRGYQCNTESFTELDSGEGNYSILKLGDIVEGKIDYDFLKTFDADSEKVEKFLLKDGDVLLSSRGKGYKVGIVQNIKNNKVVPSENIIVIRPNQEYIIPMYLYCFLNCDLGKQCVQRIQTGSVIPVVSKNNLDSMEVPVIDQENQLEVINKYQQLNDDVVKTRNELKIKENKLNDFMNKLKF